MLAETGAGRAADGRNPTALRALLIDAFERLQGAHDRFPEPNEDVIRGYERRSLVGDFVRLTRLGETSASPGPAGSREMEIPVVAAATS